MAAPYADSSSWYRARVLGTLENGNLDLYWVDFGDNGEAPASALRALRCVGAGGSVGQGLSGVGEFLLAAPVVPGKWGISHWLWQMLAMCSEILQLQGQRRSL